MVTKQEHIYPVVCVFKAHNRNFMFLFIIFILWPGRSTSLA